MNLNSSIWNPSSTTLPTDSTRCSLWPPSYWLSSSTHNQVVCANELHVNTTTLSFFHPIRKILASIKMSQYSPAWFLSRPTSILASCHRRVHIPPSWMRLQHCHLLYTSLELIPIQHVCGFSHLLAKALPIKEEDWPSSGNLEVVTLVYPQSAYRRIRISSNVTPVGLAIALDSFRASYSLYQQRLRTRRQQVPGGYSDTLHRTQVFSRKPIYREKPAWARVGVTKEKLERADQSE